MTDAAEPTPFWLSPHPFQEPVYTDPPDGDLTEEPA
ncbi:hypothetical protein STENM36S_08720 [Streptomyces tendae]